MSSTCFIGVHIIGVRLMSHACISTGANLINMHLIGVHLIDMHPIDVHLTGVRSLIFAAIWKLNLRLRTRRTIQLVKPCWFTTGHSEDVNANGLQKEEESLILQLEDYQDEGMELCEEGGQVWQIAKRWT
jgi:hypothetical protein